MRGNDIFYSGEEIKFRAEVKEYAAAEILPLSNDFDEGTIKIREIVKKLGEKGYMGVSMPKEYGGQGKSVVFEMILCEELGAINYGVAAVHIASSLFLGYPLVRFGTEEQKKKYLVPITTGQRVSGMGMTEPTAGSDVAGTKTEAVLEGDFYILKGEKRFIGCGSEADFLLTFAITDPSVHAHKGMTAFIAETSDPGFELVKVFDLLGWVGVGVSHLRYNNLKVPRDNILGKLNHGFIVAGYELDAERVAAAAAGIGMARAAFEIAVKYSSERKQFDVPIRTFEGVNFKVADMAIGLEAMSLLNLKVARMIEEGVTASKESAISKLFAAEGTFSVVNDALQIMGGIGLTKEYPIEKFFRDARALSIAGGTNEILKYLIQREVYKEFGL
ncbi:MAG: acyl-CoA dehydrogenase family protein [Thermodesulfobacteriota bacterium]